VKENQSDLTDDSISVFEKIFKLAEYKRYIIFISSSMRLTVSGCFIEVATIKNL
jgi:hypothetical protein